MLFRQRQREDAEPGQLLDQRQRDIGVGRCQSCAWGATRLSAKRRISPRTGPACRRGRNRRRWRSSAFRSSAGRGGPAWRWSSLGDQRRGRRCRAADRPASRAKIVRPATFLLVHRNAADDLLEIFAGENAVRRRSISVKRSAVSRCAKAATFSASRHRWRARQGRGRMLLALERRRVDAALADLAGDGVAAAVGKVLAASAADSSRGMRSAMRLDALSALASLATDTGRVP